MTEAEKALLDAVVAGSHGYPLDQRSQEFLRLRRAVALERLNASFPEWQQQASVLRYEYQKRQEAYFGFMRRVGETAGFGHQFLEAILDGEVES